MDPIIDDYYERRYKKNNPNTDRNAIIIGILAFIVFSVVILYIFKGPPSLYYFPEAPQTMTSNLLS